MMRWCRRNPAIAGLAATAAALLIVIAVVSTASAIHLSRLAERERRHKSEAEQSFTLASDAVDAMLTKVGDERLANVPYLEEVRRGILEDALSFCRGLLDTRPTDPALRQELARAHHRVGKINALLGHGRDAETSYEEAIMQLERLNEEFPGDYKHRHYLAVSHNELAELLRESGGRPEDAERHYRKALAIQLALASPDGSADARWELTRTYNNLGILLMDTGRLAEAAAELRKASDGLERLVNEEHDHPHLPTYQSDLARTSINAGVLSRKQGDVSQAEAAYELAIGTLGRLVATHPEDRDYDYRLAISQLDLANLLLIDAARPQDARRHCESAKKRLQSLKDSYPGIPRYYRDLANCCITEANILAGAGEREAAESSFQQALECFDEIESRFPNVSESSAEFHSIRALALGGLAYLANVRNAPEEARRLAERAVEEQSSARRLESANPKYGQFLRQHYLFLVPILEQLGEDDEAQRVRQKAEELTPAA
jgi:tetratricopeptide (TPR) repeat protein